MNAAPRNPSTTSWRAPASLSGLRSQAAFVRALLDELERTVPAGSEEAMSVQLAEELARLGVRCLEAATSLDAHTDHSRRCA